jgi:hypothetical protein
MGRSRWVDGKSFPKKKNQVGKVAKKKLRLGRRKGKQKKVKLGWHRDRKENPINAPSIHVGALVGAGSLWPSYLTKSTTGHLEK